MTEITEASFEFRHPWRLAENNSPLSWEPGKAARWCSFIHPKPEPVVPPKRRWWRK